MITELEERDTVPCMPDVEARLLRDGAEPVASTAAEFRTYIEADVRKWAKVIAAAGLRFEP